MRISSVLIAVVCCWSWAFASTLTPPGYLGSGTVGATMRPLGGTLNPFGADPWVSNRTVTNAGRSTGSGVVFYRFDATATPNRVRFDPVPFTNVAWGEEFLLGYLTFDNGRWYLQQDLFELSIQTIDFNALSPPLAGPRPTQTFAQSAKFQIALQTVPNTFDTPEQNADLLYITALSGGVIRGSSLGSLRVYEDQSGTVELFGSFGSLNLVRFGQVTSPSGSAFVADCESCNLPADFIPSSTGNGFFAPPPPSIDLPTPVPEPSTLALTLVVSMPIFLARRRRNRGR